MRVKKTIYPDVGAPIVSYDPPEMVAEITADTAGTLNTPTVLTAHSGPGTFTWYYYDPGASIDVPVTYTGWLSKNEGYTIKDTGATITLNLRGKGSVYDSGVDIVVLSNIAAMNRAGDPPPNWGDPNYNFFYEASTTFYTDQGLLCCGCLKPMFPDPVIPTPPLSFSWKNTFECEAQNNDDLVLNISKTIASVSVGDDAKSEPYLTAKGFVTYEDYETFTPSLYRVDKSALTTFVDITPNDGTNDFVPMNPYALSADPANPGFLNAVVVGAGNSRRIAWSEDYGATWTIAPSGSFYWGIKQTDVFGLAWGYNVIEYTEDAFDSVTDLIGDWTTSIDPNLEYITAVRAVI